jgi:hypothetical protein
MDSLRKKPLRLLLLAAITSLNSSLVNADELMDMINNLEPNTAIDDSMSSYESYIEDPDATKVSGVYSDDGRTSGAISEQELASASLSDMKVASIYAQDGRVRATATGDYILPCSACESADSVGLVAVQDGDSGDIRYVEVTQDEALALVSLEAMAVSITPSVPVKMREQIRILHAI